MNLKIEFTDKQITPWGGMILLKNMLDKLNFRQVIAQCKALPTPNSNRGYHTWEIIESFIVNVWAGATKFVHTEVSRNDYPLKEIFDWRRHPSQETYRRFFKKFNIELNSQIFPSFYKWFFNNLVANDLTIDIDSSVFTRYGNQQGAKRGYNPTKPGRLSHHPLIAVVADVNMIANFWLRSGDAYTTNNFINFLEQTLDNLSGKRIGLIRLDSGFYDKNIFNYLENKGINYIVAARFTSSIKRLLGRHQGWLSIAEGVEVASVEYQSPLWDKPRRVILVRQHVGYRPKATGKQLRLPLPEDEAYYRNYRYSAYVTNLTLPAAEVWRIYRRRAEAENRIKELAYDYGVKSFNLSDFYATEAALNFVMIAYNLMNLFRRFIMHHTVQQRLSTLRYKTFAIGAYLARKNGYVVLVLSLKFKQRKWFTSLWNKSQNFKFPFKV